MPNTGLIARLLGNAILYVVGAAVSLSSEVADLRLK